MANDNVKVVQQEKMSFLERSYVPEILRGLGVTIKHFFKATTGKNYRNEETGAARDAWYLNKGNVTYQYPEHGKPYYPERYRGQHRLMLRENGNVRCVACMCCSTICPANCIHITAAEHDDPTIEKYPTAFIIDELRCIFCGFCVEACPCDAIRMDSGAHVKPFYDRNMAYFNRDLLMDVSRVAGINPISAAVQGGENN